MIPRYSQRVEHEGELAVVIGKECKKLALAGPHGESTTPSAEAAATPPNQGGEFDWREYVLGYTCLNDVTARDLQKSDGQFARAKSFDTFCPIGPWMETELDVSDVRVMCRVNGEVRQEGRTSQMVFGVEYLIRYISNMMTLLPGDIIATGTPAGVGPLVAGDVCEVEIEGIGTLRNSVINA